MANVKIARLKLKEASYSRVPVGISLHVSIFPILAVLEIHFMAYSSSHKSNLSVSSPYKFALYPMKHRKLSSWAKEDGILTIWDWLRQRMLRTPKNNCILLHWLKLYNMRPYQWLDILMGLFIVVPLQTFYMASDMEFQMRLNTSGSNSLGCLVVSTSWPALCYPGSNPGHGSWTFIS